MNKKIKDLMWFALSFLLSFGAYVFCNYYFDWNEGYGAFSATFAIIIAAAVCFIMYAIFKNKNINFARGFTWGLLAMALFLFSYGGCGFLF